MFHDHVPAGTTTDGMEPGGNIAFLAYKGLQDERGMPKMHEQTLGEVFDRDYYAKNQPLWQQSEYAKLFADAGRIQPDLLKLIQFGLLAGLILALIFVLIRLIKGKQSS
jgi:hypothetical protein